MSDEYTPATEDVREAWAKRNALYRSTSLAGIGHRAHVATNDARYSAEDYAQFDRWLAEHDREVREECARTAEAMYPLGSRVSGDAPAKIAAAIRALPEGGTR